MRNLGVQTATRKHCTAVACAVTAWLAFVGPVPAQETPAPPPPAQWAPAQPVPPQSEPVAPAAVAPVPPQAIHKPGLFEAVGRWVDRGLSDLRGHMRGAKQRMDNLGDEAAANNKDIADKAAAAGKNAADAMPKLPAARMIDGREKCAIAPNGAPDCLSAAQALCRRHGYASGKSMDFTSAEECPVKALLGQETRDSCKTVTFISRAMCQ